MLTKFSGLANTPQPQDVTKPTEDSIQKSITGTEIDRGSSVMVDPNEEDPITSHAKAAEPVNHVDDKDAVQSPVAAAPQMPVNAGAGAGAGAEVAYYARTPEEEKADSLNGGKGNGGLQKFSDKASNANLKTAECYTAGVQELTKVQDIKNEVPAAEKKASGTEVIIPEKFKLAFEQAFEECTLTLIDKDIDNDALKQFVLPWLEENPKVHTLCLQKNQIGEEGAKALAANKTLTSLDVGWNQIGAEGAKALAANKTLTELDVGWNQIGAEGAKALAANKTLTELDVGSNQIGDEGAKALAENKTLISLDVGWNQIGDEGAKALAANNTLTWLYASRNPIGDEGRKAFENMAIHREASRTLLLKHLLEAIQTNKTKDNQAEQNNKPPVLFMRTDLGEVIVDYCGPRNFRVYFNN